MTLQRTRFLDGLDQMVMQDRRGAIDDMLQVLREQGVIETAQVLQHIDGRYLASDQRESVLTSMKRQMGAELGRFVVKEGAATFSDPVIDSDPGMLEILLKLELVRRPE